jgi:hypothetical protein
MAECGKQMCVLYVRDNVYARDCNCRKSNYDIIRDLLFSLLPLLEIRDLFLSLAEGQSSVRYIDGVEMVAIATTTPSRKFSSPYSEHALLCVCVRMRVWTIARSTLCCLVDFHACPPCVLYVLWLFAPSVLCRPSAASLFTNVCPQAKSKERWALRCHLKWIYLC